MFGENFLYLLRCVCVGEEGMPFLYLKPGQPWRRGMVGSSVHPPFNFLQSPVQQGHHPLPVGPGGIFITQPFESLLHSGRGWGTLTLKQGRLELASRRDWEPHFPAPPFFLLLFQRQLCG